MRWKFVLILWKIMYMLQATFKILLLVIRLEFFSTTLKPSNSLTSPQKKKAGISKLKFKVIMIFFFSRYSMHYLHHFGEGLSILPQDTRYVFMWSCVKHKIPVIKQHPPYSSIWCHELFSVSQGEICFEMNWIWVHRSGEGKSDTVSEHVKKKEKEWRLPGNWQ